MWIIESSETGKNKNRNNNINSRRSDYNPPIKPADARAAFESDAIKNMRLASEYAKEGQFKNAIEVMFARMPTRTH